MIGGGEAAALRRAVGMCATGTAIAVADAVVLIDHPTLLGAFTLGLLVPILFRMYGELRFLYGLVHGPERRSYDPHSLGRVPWWRVTSIAFECLTCGATSSLDAPSGSFPYVASPRATRCTNCGAEGPPPQAA